MKEFQGKHFLITGASRGLGRICAHYFSKKGATLLLTARNKDDLEKTRQECFQEHPGAEKHYILPTDLSDEKAIPALIDQALSSVGHVDSVLHCAGGGLGFKNPLLTRTEFEKLLQLNLFAACEINRHLVPLMQAKGQGNLVHVGSIAGREATGSVGYNTAKAALHAYVRTLGNELARSGIIVTGIAPGGFLAPENAMERLRAKDPDGYKRFIDERLPRGRMGSAHELLPLLELLMGPQGSIFSGCMVPMDAAEGVSY